MNQTLFILTQNVKKIKRLTVIHKFFKLVRICLYLAKNVVKLYTYLRKKVKKWK
jgi:hypothetical protein